MSEMREVMKKLREAGDTGEMKIEAWQRGNFTMVRLVYHRPGSQDEIEGIGFAKRDPSRYPAPGFRFDCYPIWRKDELSYARGIEIATGRAIRDLAEQIVRSEEVADDVPF